MGTGLGKIMPSTSQGSPSSRNGLNLRRNTSHLTKRVIVALLLLLSTVSATAGATENEAVGDASVSPTKDFIVGLDQSPSAMGIRPGELFYGGTVVSVSEQIGFIVVRTGSSDVFASRVLADSRVLYVEENRPAFRPSFMPNDPFYLGTPDGLRQWAPDRINAPSAWNVTLGKGSVVVAVLDSGIDRYHDDIEFTRVLPGWNFVDDNADVTDVVDFFSGGFGHGTAVSAIIAAKINNAQGIAGMAQVSILPVKVLGPFGGSFSSIANGIVFATDNGASIISMSLGCPTSLGRQCDSRAVRDAVQYAWNRGALLIAAAGNEGPCVDCVEYPAKYPEVMAVTCTDELDQACYFTSQGPEAEIAAPGNNICVPIIHVWYPHDAVCFASGTSFSAPHLAGVAALIKSAFPSWTNQQVRDRLHSAVADLGIAGVDALFGYGRVDAAAALESSPSVNKEPFAAFTFTKAGGNITFDATSSADLDGVILSYSWNFGDGSTGKGETATHTYLADGVHEVVLTVRDEQGATGSTMRAARALTTNPILFSHGFEGGRKGTLSPFKLVTVNCPLSFEPCANLWHVDDQDAASESFSLTYNNAHRGTLNYRDYQTFGVALFRVDLRDLDDAYLDYQLRIDVADRLGAFGGPGALFDVYAWRDAPVAYSSPRPTFGSEVAMHFGYPRNFHQKYFPLEAAMGRIAYVEFRVWSWASDVNDWPGVFIDDVKVVAGPLPANNVPVATFQVAGVNGLDVTVDASASYDPDPWGVVAAVRWQTNGDERPIGRDHAGQLRTTFSFDRGGTYNITLFIGDQQWAFTSITQTIAVTPVDVMHVHDFTVVRARDSMLTGTVEFRNAAELAVPGVELWLTLTRLRTTQNDPFEDILAPVTTDATGKAFITGTFTLPGTFRVCVTGYTVYKGGWEYGAGSNHAPDGFFEDIHSLGPSFDLYCRDITIT